MTQTTTLERPLPYNRDAERSVLGAVLLDNRVIEGIGAHMQREDFFLDGHRRIFTQMVALSATQRAIDLVTLTEELHNSGELQNVGGAPYLASLTDGMPRISNVKFYADIVREKARRRRVIHLCHAIQESAFAGEEKAQKLLENGAQEFLSMMSQEGANAMPSTWGEAVMSAMDEIVDSMRNPGATLRWNFGIPKIDDNTAGFRRQDLNLLVGMTSHGKSLLAMQGAVTADVAGYKGLIFSAEMSKEALAKRELAHTANVPLYLLRRPECIRHPDEVIADLTGAALKERGRRLLVVDRDINSGRVWSLCELVHRSSGLDFVIVDYDQLVIRAGLKMRDDEFRAQAEFMADALAICKRLNICFVLLCQPRKVDEDVARGRRPPRVEQIFGSSAVANTAHNILWIMRGFFIHGMDLAYEKTATAYILKARNDKTGKMDIGFDPDRVLFVNEQEPVVEKESRVERKKREKEERERES